MEKPRFGLPRAGPKGRVSELSLSPTEPGTLIGRWGVKVVAQVSENRPRAIPTGPKTEQQLAPCRAPEDEVNPLFCCSERCRLFPALKSFELHASPWGRGGGQAGSLHSSLEPAVRVRGLGSERRGPQVQRTEARKSPPGGAWRAGRGNAHVHGHAAQAI